MTPSLLKPARRRLMLVVAALACGALAGRAVIALCSRVETQATHGQTGLLYSLNSDPSVAPGLSAPQWQVLVRTDVPSLYYKSGTSNTAWTRIGNGAAGGGGSVTSVACGANLSCSPSPIVAAGTVSTVAAPTFSGTVTGGAFATAGNVLAATGAVLAATVQATGGIVSSDTGIVLGGAPDRLTLHLDLTGTPLYSSTSDPNGTTPVNTSAVDFDSGNHKVWFNTSGSTWVSSGGGGAVMFDTVLSTTITAATFSTVNNVSFGGTLGKVTYVQLNQTGSQYTITGWDASTATNGAVVFVQSVSAVAACPTAWFLSNEDAGSSPGNRILVPGGAGVNTTSACQGGEWLRYDGAVSRWRVMEKV